MESKHNKVMVAVTKGSQCNVVNVVQTSLYNSDQLETNEVERIAVSGDDVSLFASENYE